MVPLFDLVASLGDEVVRVHGEGAAAVSGVAYDSRAVRPGDMFIAVEGFKSDGHQYLEQALAAGASALVVRDPSRAPRTDHPIVEVRDTRRALALCSAAFHGWPGRALTMIGVTGTNGKTTTSILIEGILSHAGRRPGLIGTMFNRIGGQTKEAKNTTPESLDLQRLLARMRDAGHDCVSMEVSSHGLALERVAGCAFDVGVFTNLTQDHLDFHADLDEYFRAKRMLFESLGRDNPKSAPRGAVINADDPRCEEVRAVTSVPVMTYGINNPADLRATDIRHTPNGVAFRLHTTEGSREALLRLSGLFNVYNALAALGAALTLQIPLEVALDGLRLAAPVRGRFETVRAGQDFTVIVDYAHTPNGLENILKGAREVTEGRVLVVFGCGGDRDPKKRPIMGEIATRLADEVVVTSDNPRSEAPEAILAQISAGAPGATVIEDRRTAIGHAIGRAAAGDTVVIAGKGHETYQILKDKTIDFDDAEEARIALRARLEGG
ncbi:MAG: UDP-N-acetylmuramoyl-L-alanyl-D-glutamate--2,6-diaminopimelate ligase [Armatimonadetes bacterium]|nr:UDP-N-acetylmuramoyl-L-alanyl-D-glutamate--2,6-diaminopimelate ligase [Armatimonadota bacterium]